jgi:hypothetical protein
VVYPVDLPPYGEEHSEVSLVSRNLLSNPSSETVIHRDVWVDQEVRSDLPGFQAAGHGALWVAQPLKPESTRFGEATWTLERLAADGSTSTIPVVLAYHQRPSPPKQLPLGVQDTWRWLRSFGE